MMHAKRYIAWRGKPQNGSVDPDDAKERFKKLYEDPTTITDLLGPTEKLAKRIAVETKTLLANRDAITKSEALEIKTPEKKKASQADIDIMEKRVWPFACYTCVCLALCCPPLCLGGHL